MTAFVVIPARGGSKGIRAKNRQPVGGVPLIARAVSTASAARSVDRVFVSTDDETIGDLARSAGADVVARPPELSGDDAPSETALLHTLDALERLGSTEPDVTVMMQCTSPFTLPSDVDGTAALIDGDRYDCAFTAVRTHAFLWRRDDGTATAVNHDATSRPRRQDRVAEFVETGAVYAMRTTGLRAARHRFFGRIGIFEVPADRALEIDEPRDLALAELILERAGEA